jgi:hypothetical protein
MSCRGSSDSRVVRRGLRRIAGVTRARNPSFRAVLTQDRGDKRMRAPPVPKAYKKLQQGEQARSVIASLRTKRRANNGGKAERANNEDCGTRCGRALKKKGLRYRLLRGECIIPKRGIQYPTTMESLRRRSKGISGRQLRRNVFLSRVGRALSNDTRLPPQERVHRGKKS